MRYETRTVRVGELDISGTVDEWLVAHATSGAPELHPEQVSRLRRVVDLLAEGGQPAVEAWSTWRRVHCVGLYDGWVHWKPRVAVLIAGVLGPEVLEFDRVGGVRRTVPCGHERPCPGLLCRGWRLAPADGEE